MTDIEPLGLPNLARLRKSVRVTRIMAIVVLGVFAALGVVLVNGAWVAMRLGQTGTLVAAVVGLVILALAGLMTIGLVRRQRTILEAAETLMEITGDRSARP